jgi:hypothetical protein
MPAEKMTVALLEAHYSLEQDQDREEANSAFLGLIDRGTKGRIHIKRRPLKDSRFLPLLPGSGPICALSFIISELGRLDCRTQAMHSANPV